MSFGLQSNFWPPADPLRVMEPWARSLAEKAELLIGVLRVAGEQRFLARCRIDSGSQLSAWLEPCSPREGSVGAELTAEQLAGFLLADMERRHCKDRKPENEGGLFAVHEEKLDMEAVKRERRRVLRERTEREAALAKTRDLAGPSSWGRLSDPGQAQTSKRRAGRNT